MKRIVVSMLAIVCMGALQAQERRLRPAQKSHHDKIMAEKLKFSDEQRKKAKELNEEFRKKMTALRNKEDILVKDWKSQLTEL
ncbi:MAG TPA: hypothetical protein VF144_19810, partial [Chitinophagaceae bacterium]